MRKCAPEGNLPPAAVNETPLLVMIRTRDLCVHHPGGIQALRGVDLDVARGEWVAIMGPNGSGKTTLARCLNALLLPTSGAVTIDGLSTAEEARHGEIRRRVGMVFQHPDDQLVAPTVESEIAFGLENHGVEPAVMRRRVEEVLRQFDLDNYRNHPPHLLSGGERQRLAVASAVAVRPRYLVLDEPTALLDPPSRRNLIAAVSGLWRRHGLTILQITQSPEEAARAERLLVLCAGRLIEDGPPSKVFSAGCRLRRVGLSVPFAVEAVEAAGGGASDALDSGELATWLTHRFDPEGQRAGAPDAAAAGSRSGRLSARRVGHTYRSGVPAPLPALHAVDLEVHAGRITGLLGPGGSGKTTLAQHLNGLLRPAAGQVLLDGRDIWSSGDAAAVRRSVGLVFQFPETQLFEESVQADVAFGPRSHGCGEAESQRRAVAALDAVGLPAPEFGSRPPLDLSGGERRRAAIAGVLSVRPSFLVLDEPTAGLDRGNRERIADLLRGLARDGRGVVLISHDMDLVADLCEEITFLEGGRVRWHGPTRATFAKIGDSRDGGNAAELPAALRLAIALRRLGWKVPSWMTRGEACDFLRGLRRREEAGK